MSTIALTWYKSEGIVLVKNSKRCLLLSSGLVEKNETCGILKSRSKLATWMEVTLEAAPTTPEITLRTCVLLQLYSAPSMLLIDPMTSKSVSRNVEPN